MKNGASSQELRHEIFGSVLDREEMTPHLLLKSADYESALRQATRMTGNRGFDTYGSDEFEERMNRLFKGRFHLPEESFKQVRKDQGKRYARPTA